MQGQREVQQQLQRKRSLDGIKLIALDADGVFRNSRKLVIEALNGLVKAQGLDLPFDSEDLGRIRSVQHYCDGAKGLISAQRAGLNLKEVLASKNLPETLDELVAKYMTSADDTLMQRIRDKHKEIVESPKRPGANPGVDLSLFDAMIVKNDVMPDGRVVKGKPSGEDVRILMDMFNVSKEDTLYLGDAPSDIKVAKDSGAASISVLSGDGGKEQLASLNPDYMFNDLLTFSKYMECIRLLRTLPIPMGETKEQAKAGDVKLRQ